MARIQLNLDGSAELKVEDLELSAVTFVRDYVQLDFDGRSFTCITWPTIIGLDQVELTIGQRGFRDELCGLIGKSLRRGNIVSKKEMVLEFTTGVRLRISLRPESSRAAEAVIFRDELTKEWCSW